MKKIFCLLMVAVLTVILVGCTTSLTYTYTVETGDVIEVKLNTTNDLSMSHKPPIEITRNDTHLSDVIFIEKATYENYFSAAQTSENAVVLENAEKDGNKYLMWCYAGREWNYVLLVGDSETGVLIGNAVSEESARECFEALTFSLAD